MSESPRIFVSADLEAALDDAILASLDQGGYGVHVAHPRMSEALAREALEAAGGYVDRRIGRALVGRGWCAFRRRTWCVVISVAEGVPGV